jgi:hypothetical protein
MSRGSASSSPKLRVGAGVHPPELVVPDRASTPGFRSSTGCPGASDRAYDLTGKAWARENHLLGSGDLRSLFPGPVRIVNLGLTLVAIT